MVDAYRPSYGGPPPRGDNYAPHPRDGSRYNGGNIDRYAPGPPGPPPPMRSFGTHANNEYGRRRPQDEFTFRSGREMPSSEFDPALYRNGPQPERSYRQMREDADRRRHGGNDRRRGGHRGGKNFYNDRRRIATADRPLLQFARGKTPEQLQGMGFEEDADGKFLDIDDVSDSAEEDMEESADEEGDAEGGLDGQSGEQPPKKKRKTEAPKAANELPKWSNPEVYTAMPPVDESTRKKRDVVRLIRKARVSAGKASDDVTNAVATNDDFISFGMDDEESEDEILLQAPNGPRAMVGQQQVSVETVTSTTTPAVEVVTQKVTLDEAPVVENVDRTTAVQLLDSLRKRKRSPSPTVLHILPELHDVLAKPEAQHARTGYVLPQWTAKNPAEAVPWIKNNHRDTIVPGFRLHKEILDFYDFIKPQDFEQEVRNNLIVRLRKFIKTWGIGWEVHCFGSFAAGLYLPNSDMDVVVMSPSYKLNRVPLAGQSANQIHKLGRALAHAGIARAGYEVIAHARVPLIKFVDPVTNLRVDLSFENDSGTLAVQTIDRWKAQFPALPIIVTVIKQFLMMRGLNDVHLGGIGGFSITCLVASLLHNQPSIQNGQLKPEENLGEVLIEFLDLYGNQFDYARTAVRMETPGYVDKRSVPGLRLGPGHNQRLCIIDPNNPSNDISGGSRNIDLIFGKFSQALDFIRDAVQGERRKSLLDWMLGGNYEVVYWYRHQLKQVHGTIFPGRTRKDALYTVTDVQSTSNKPSSAQPGSLESRITTAAKPLPSQPNATASNAEVMEIDGTNGTTQNGPSAQAAPSALPSKKLKGKAKAKAEDGLKGPKEKKPKLSKKEKKKQTREARIVRKAEARAAKIETEPHKARQRAEALKLAYPHMFDKIGAGLTREEAKQIRFEAKQILLEQGQQPKGVVLVRDPNKPPKKGESEEEQRARSADVLRVYPELAGKVGERLTHRQAKAFRRQALRKRSEQKGRDARARAAVAKVERRALKSQRKREAREALEAADTSNAGSAAPAATNGSQAEPISID